MKYTEDELKIIRGINYSHEAYSKVREYAIKNTMTLGEAYIHIVYRKKSLEQETNKV